MSFFWPWPTGDFSTRPALRASGSDPSIVETIYVWRLADMRRVLDLAGALRGLRRVDLVTNYTARARSWMRVAPEQRQRRAFRKTAQGACRRGQSLVLGSPRVSTSTESGGC